VDAIWRHRPKRDRRVDPGIVGADLANLSNEAALQAVSRGHDTVRMADFTTSHEKIMLGAPRDEPRR
jgi:cell division protease FtsH